VVFWDETHEEADRIKNDKGENMNWDENKSAEFEEELEDETAQERVARQVDEFSIEKYVLKRLPLVLLALAFVTFLMMNARNPLI